MNKKIILLPLISLSLLSCDNNAKPFTLTNLGNELVMHQRIVEDFLLNPVDAAVDARGNIEYSIGNPIPLSWNVGKAYESSSYIIKVSEHSDMSDSWTFTTNATSYNLYNCKINTQYYWTVSNGTVTSEIATFRSKNTKVRQIYVDGVTNFRDLGGYVTENGKIVKQGLIYRCARFNTSSTDVVCKEITPAGEKTLLEQLKMKTEIDLRKTNDEAGHLDGHSCVEGLEYKLYGMDSTQNILERNTTKIKALFEEVLCKEESYPLCFHCNIGTDRTGFLAYTILTLLGVNKADAVGDYLLSNYGTIGSSRRFSNVEPYYPTSFEDEPGATLSAKVINALDDYCDISIDTINKVKSILLED